jgi:hypothetical protein
VSQQLGLRKPVKHAARVQLTEADFVGQLGGKALRQSRFGGGRYFLVVAGVVGIYVGHAQRRAQVPGQVLGQGLNQAAGRAQDGQLVAAEFAEVGAGQGGVFGFFCGSSAIGRMPGQGAGRVCFN